MSSQVPSGPTHCARSLGNLGGSKPRSAGHDFDCTVALRGMLHCMLSGHDWARQELCSSSLLEPSCMPVSCGQVQQQQQQQQRAEARPAQAAW